MKNIVCVVGDKFFNFSNKEQVLTFTDFINVIKKNNKYNDCHVIMGQGLNSFERNILQALSQKNIIDNTSGYFSESASKQITHKIEDKNIMISEPIELENIKSYSADLLLDDECSEMSDHVTGKHIQGMVLTEAARQIMLAVSEKYLINKSDQMNSYCVLLKVESIFHEFAFPIETKLIHDICNLSRKCINCYKAETRTKFYQNDRIISEININYMFYDKKQLIEKESILAKSAYQKNILLNENEFHKTIN